MHRFLSFRVLLFTVFAVAFGLRAALILSVADDPVFAMPMLDAEYAVEWALEVARGDVWGSPEETAYFRTPLYSWFLAACFALPGDDLMNARWVQALLGALAAVLLTDLACRRFGAAAAIGTGTLAAISWPLLVFSHELFIVGLAVPLGTLLLWLWERSSGDRLGSWILLGAILATTIWARPNYVLLLPFVVITPWIVGARRPVRMTTATVATVVALVLPMTVRNYQVSGEWIPLSYQGGLNLWIGNHPGADGMSATLPGFRSWDNADVEAMLARETGRPVGPGDQDRHFRQLAFEFFRESPGQASLLLLRKTYLFLQGYEIRNNRDLESLRERTGWLHGPWPDFGWLLPLAVVGMVWFGASRKHFALWAYPFVMALSVIAFFVCARYRLPAWPPLLVWAGAGVGALLERDLSVGRRALRLAALAVLLFLARWDFLGIRNPDASQPHFQYGNVYARLEDFGRAEQEYRTALSLNPTLWEARYHLGALYLLTGRAPEALGELERAVRGMPESFPVRRAFAEALEASGEVERAVEERREAMRLSAGHPDDALAFANALGRAGRYDEAVEQFERLRATPLGEDPTFLLNSGQTLLYLGQEERGLRDLAVASQAPSVANDVREVVVRYYASRGRSEEAFSYVERELAKSPESGTLYRLRGILRGGKGDLAGAREDLLRAIELNPSDEQARALLQRATRNP